MFLCNVTFEGTFGFQVLVWTVKISRRASRVGRSNRSSRSKRPKQENEFICNTHYSAMTLTSPTLASLRKKTFFYVGLPKESIFLTTFYGLYFSHQYTNITNYISSWYRPSDPRKKTLASRWHWPPWHWPPWHWPPWHWKLQWGSEYLTILIQYKWTRCAGKMCCPHKTRCPCKTRYARKMD